MYNAIFELGEFGLVPAVGGAYEVACDALQLVYVMAAAMRACVERFLGVLIAAMHAAVAVVVHRAIAYVVCVHEVYDVGYGLWIVGGVAVDFHIEDVAASGEFVVGAFYFGFVAGRALVVYRHVV